MSRKKSAKAMLEEVREVLRDHRDLPGGGMSRKNPYEQALRVIGDMVGVDMGGPEITDWSKKRYAAMKAAKATPAGPA